AFIGDPRPAPGPAEPGLQADWHSPAPDTPGDGTLIAVTEQTGAATPLPRPSGGAADEPGPGQGTAVAKAPGCDPAPRPVTVRPLDPHAVRAVNRQWRRVERWLRANAPRTYEKLKGPGRARTIAVAESQMGLDFPDDLRASLLRHDGAPWPGPPGGTSLGVRQIRDAWRHLCASEGHPWWTGRMIPFSVHQGRAGTEYAAVDPVSGAVTVDGALTAQDYRARLREIADALERGRQIDGRAPEVRRGVLRWVRAG
ncbi:hypothetical protein OUY22_35655, partial [Nonomuraea sp. MCN248]|nr:hypothetical protein [Nonomuraea corallina]